MIDLSRIFRGKSRVSGVDPQPAPPRESDVDHNPARVSISGLIALQRAAATLPLRSRLIRAQQGGGYRSAFKGRGMEFDEARPYQAGDEVRHLDWRVTARTGKPYTKMFREERERPVFLWVDYRSTMFFATRGAFKSVRAAQAAALLAWSAHHHGDRVGSIIFSEHDHQELKPVRGQIGALHLIKQLAEHPAWRKIAGPEANADAELQALKRLQRVVRPGSLIFLLSDFRGMEEAARSLLIQLSRHNDIVMLFIHDPLEHQLPAKGRYRLSDGQHELTLNTGDRQFREDYEQRFKSHRQYLQTLARQFGLYFLACSTTQQPLNVLREGL
ncbi:MAG: DUF58 domain-containing protein [Pseudomonadota bacterium]